ncbi:Aminomethyltransferase folate-binding domain-containing protein [Pleurostoma richardsiae]|uniref:Iron-sulfur cluster assembly factor IBA57 homolog, mitochondrial n=1 Tax=Pleurostoma richardsiae TaxID=41990 RepID=A0AA38S806_9PEZI|nr:Aminomethyltransferase folate-binding domain-containing protein [Pleurostoma richardsiae]
MPPTSLRPRPLKPRFVCRSCLSSRRQPFSSSSIPTSPPAPTPSGYAPLPSRRLISLSGPDAAKYLQGVITANIHGSDGHPRDRGFYTAFLNAQGRILHDVFVYPDGITAAGRGGQPGDSFLIEVDAGEAERLQKHIKRYKLRAKFNVRLLDQGELSIWQAWDDAGKVELGDATVPGLLQLQDTRAPGLGYRLITAQGAAPTLELEPTSEAAYHVRRYLHGVPEGQEELERERALPHESNMDIMGGVDFHKGCYVGQELTIRTQHRGVVRKRVLPCVLYAPERPAPDHLTYRPAVESEEAGDIDAAMIPADQSIGRVGKKGRSAGRWLRGVGNVGLALCRLEIMTDMVLPGEAPSASYNPADEFIIEQKSEDGSVGQAVKVKAFVPDWLRRGLEQGR